MKPCKHLFSRFKLVHRQSVEQVTAGLLTLSLQYVMVTHLTIGMALDGGKGGGSKEGGGVGEAKCLRDGRV